MGHPLIGFTGAFNFLSLGYLRARLHTHDFHGFVDEVQEAMALDDSRAAVERLQRAEERIFGRLQQTTASWGRLAAFVALMFGVNFLDLALVILKDEASHPLIFVGMSLFSITMVCVFMIAGMVADCWRLEVTDRLNMPRVLKASMSHLGNMPAAHFQMKYRSHGIRIFGMIVDSQGVSRLIFGLGLTLAIAMMRTQLQGV